MALLALLFLVTLWALGLWALIRRGGAWRRTTSYLLGTTLAAALASAAGTPLAANSAEPQLLEPLERPQPPPPLPFQLDGGESAAVPAESVNHGQHYSSPAPPVVVFASRSNGLVMDISPGGGGPFATSLVEMLSRPRLTIGEMAAEIAEHTFKASGGFQRPEVLGTIANPDWPISPAPEGGKRHALVVAFADYSNSPMDCLPGARRDLHRVAAALAAAAFETRALLDPTAAELQTALAEFAELSAAADAAAVFATGHGAEVDGAVYLLPNDYPMPLGAAALPYSGLPLASLAAATRARQLNLVLYGSCRDNPFESPGKLPGR